MKSHIRPDHTFLKFETKLEGNLVVNLIDLNAGKPLPISGNFLFSYLHDSLDILNGTAH